VSAILFVFEGTVEVEYGAAWVVSAETDTPAVINETFAGQSNGLLGAAVPGFLMLATVRSGGDVPIGVTIESAEPQLDEAWEECVEATFIPQGPTVKLWDFWWNVVAEISARA
jgi:hypothetical protein